MKPRQRAVSATVCLTLVFLIGCKGSTAKKLAVASDTIAHALKAAQDAVNLGVTDGVVSASEQNDLNGYFVQVARAGLVLDSAIKKNESAPNVAAEVNTFLAALNALTQQGVVGIKDPRTKLAVATALNGAEAAVAVIASVVGSGGK